LVRLLCAARFQGLARQDVPRTAAWTGHGERGVTAKKPLRLFLENWSDEVQHPILIATTGKKKLPVLQERKVDVLI
jgi:hypothetical protein